MGQVEKVFRKTWTKNSRYRSSLTQPKFPRIPISRHWLPFHIKITLLRKWSSWLSKGKNDDFTARRRRLLQTSREKRAIEKIKNPKLFGQRQQQVVKRRSAMARFGATQKRLTRLAPGWKLVFEIFVDEATSPMPEDSLFHPLRRLLPVRSEASMRSNPQKRCPPKRATVASRKIRSFDKKR